MFDDVVCWLDLETTGLDPLEHCILEVGMLLTDRDCKPLAEPFAHVIRYDFDFDIKIHDADVLYMHTRSGLLKEVLVSESGHSEVETLACAYLDSVPARRYILAGNSVHFDQSFLVEHMPKLARRFYHRHLDVSTLRHFADWWGRVPYPRQFKHRVIADIMDAIGELEYYRAIGMLVR